MSLLTSLTAGNPDQYYYIENIGGNGRGSNQVPCIRGGDVFGAVRVGDADQGMVLIGGGLGNLPSTCGVRGGYPNTTGGAVVNLGASLASASNIVLTDNLTTVNTPMTITSSIIANQDLDIDGQLFVTGNIDALSTINLVNGSLGNSISGYYAASVAVTSGAITNPAGLTPGVYVVTYVGTGAGNEQAQASGVFVRSTSIWFGNAVSTAFSGSAPSSPNTAIYPVPGGATLNLGGVSIPANGTVFFRKVLNAQ
jgi:hypothetical protein